MRENEKKDAFTSSHHSARGKVMSPESANGKSHTLSGLVRYWALKNLKIFILEHFLLIYFSEKSHV